MDIISFQLFEKMSLNVLYEKSINVFDRTVVKSDARSPHSGNLSPGASVHREHKLIHIT